jgi:hypothetical protein
MKAIKATVLSILIASLVLSTASCGNNSTETHSDIIREEIAPATRPYNAENDIAAVSLTTPPAVGISYQYKVGGEGLVAAHRITSGIFSWTVDYGNGVGQTTHVDGSRPCDAPGTQHIPLDKVKDYGYEVDVALEEEIIQSYTLTAYPVGKYDLGDGTDCTIKDGKLQVLKRKHYYELIIEYHQGKVVYGFFID